jgi:GNAT superfamily N-acetyltransferase
MQHDAQMLGYAEQFPTASHEIIELDGKSVGRLMVDRQPEFIGCVDVSILPEIRGIGMGTYLLKNLLHECDRLGVPCLLKVLVKSRAVALYERLGFVVEGGDGLRLWMRWTKNN